MLTALVLGLVIGIVIGALGGGGSVLTVPVLVFALGLSAQQATSASLVIVGVTSGAAAVLHSRRDGTRWGVGLALVLAGVPGAVLGTALNRRVDAAVLLLALAALMLLAAIGMLLRGRSTPRPAARRDDAGSAALPAGRTATSVRRAESVRPARAERFRLLAAGVTIGFLTGFLGVGGGFVIVPALVVALEFEIPVAVGTSLLVIALTSGVALAARAGQGTYAWSVIVPFTAAALAGSLAGTRVADRLPEQTLSRAFAVLLLVVAGYVTTRALTGLP